MNAVQVLIAVATVLALLGLVGVLMNPAPAQSSKSRSTRPALTIEDIDDELIELILTAHYRDVLSDPAKQRMWRKLLREASAARTVATIGR